MKKLFILSLFFFINYSYALNPIVTNPNVTDPNQIAADKAYCQSQVQSTLASQGVGSNSGPDGTLLRGAAKGAIVGAAGGALFGSSDVGKDAGIVAGLGALHAGTQKAAASQNNQNNIEAQFLTNCLQEKGYQVVGFQ